jgi:antitoxin YefM
MKILFFVFLYQIGTQKKTGMIVISSREFRDNQKKYFDLIDSNEQVIVQRGKNKSYKLVPIKEDETLMTESEFYAKIDVSIKQAQEGNVQEIKNVQDFKTLLGL